MAGNGEVEIADGAFAAKRYSLRCRWLVVMTLGLSLCAGLFQQVAAADSVSGEGGAPDAGTPWSALRHLPGDAYFVAGIRPRGLLQAIEFDEIDGLLSSLVEYSLGRRVDVLPADVEQLVLVGTYGGARLGDYNLTMVVELQSAEAANRLMSALFGSEFHDEFVERNSLKALVTVRQLAGVLLRDRTVLLGPPTLLQNWRFPTDVVPQSDDGNVWPVRSTNPDQAHAFVVFDVERLRRFAPRFDDWMLTENPWLAAASPVLRDATRLEFVCCGSDGLNTTATAWASQEALPDIDGTFRAGAAILRNVLRETQPRLPEWGRDVAGPMLALLRDSLKLPETEVDGDSGSVRLTVKASRNDIRSLRAVLLPLAESFQVSARRALRSRNLQRITMAAIDYYEDHKHLPLPIATDRDSGVPRSWRVTLLPYLGEQNLFDRYRQNEPWNSPSNQQVLRQMPDVYRHVDDSPTSYRSAYFGFVGPETAFGDGGEPARLRDIRDGISNTILVAESRQGVPWTMPSDIKVVPGRPLPSIGGFDPTGALVGRVDTQVSFLPNSLPEETRRAFVTRAGRERISLP